MEFLTLNKALVLLKSKNINVKKYLGQHFLIDRNGRDKVLSFAELEKDDVIVEIGPGLGGMTDGFVDKVKDVYALEIDPELCGILGERFASFKNFHLIEKDVLEVPDAWWAGLPDGVKVISNTPYYVSSPIAFRILEFHKKVKLALLTVQKEVGERFTAGPGSKHYGVMSVLMYIYSNAKICYSLKRDVFFPKPGVSSVVVKIVPLEKPKFVIKDEKNFWQFLHLIFSFRRKKLSNVVNKVFKLDKQFFKEACAERNISPDTRAEDLAPEELYKVFEITESAQ